MSLPEDSFLPATRAETHSRGWDEVDIVLVTGDAYVDHPSFGVALIGRWLEAHGFRVAILAQPDCREGCGDFRRFGRPRLFFGISAGNLDSIVANYTGNGRVRDSDPFSPDGNPYFPGGERKKSGRRRPDRATIVYANRAREAFPETPIILGGLEASLRRFIHYDYRQEKLRSSILVDAKADLLVYGMGERAVLEIAERLRDGKGLSGIAGTCEKLTTREVEALPAADRVVRLAGWNEITSDPRAFLKAELEIDRRARQAQRDASLLLQEQKSGWVLENPPAPILTTAELDRVYELPFTRRPHPTSGQLPAWEMIRDSITIVRGCSGNCSFCALTRHQGVRVTSRSRDSVVREAAIVASRPGFSGTISDLGGPTANLYATACDRSASCGKADCLYPEPCRHLRVDERAFIDLLAAAERVSGVRKVLVSSGLRLALLRKTPKLLARLLTRHLPGVMKIAPEHTEPEVLRLMHKNDGLELEAFLREARRLAAVKGGRAIFSPYLISSHPGCTLEEMKRLAGKLRRWGLKARQFQDFTPTPGTISTAMYVSGLDRDSFEPIAVARGASARRAQRRELEKASGRRRR
ncbi:MAG: YgiQ family radical SAM protein [Deltaproteobacteria bacterium]|nr:YgiQ family radical SAM protein [Deltaproteobacteria bacterium]